MSSFAEYQEMAINTLCEALLNDKDVRVRCIVAESLGEIRSQKAIPTLLRAIKEDVNPEARQCAVKAIGCILSIRNNPQIQSALDIWQEKLSDYQNQEAITTDAARKFELKKLIEECIAKINLLSDI